MRDDEIILRPFTGRDERYLLQLWNQTMILDPISPEIFRTRVLMDLNFNPQGLWVAEAGRDAACCVSTHLIGFVLSITRQVPLFLQGLEPELGWITAFGVHPEYRRRGVASRLFAMALSRMQEMGRKQVTISPYTPNYFIPGVDVNGYPEAMAFLKNSGWNIQYQPISMQADLTGFIIPHEIHELEQKLNDDGILIRAVEPADLPELFPFIRDHFGWDWVRHAHDYLLELMGRGVDDIAFLVALQEGKIIGYCQQKRERFGPFGVAPEFRKRGVGRVLLFKCLAEMSSRAFHCAWFLWTDEEAARLYALAGFQKKRQFAVMQYSIPNGGSHA